jgi:uncharacterized membrane protein YdjX (TVP38/TMEM64 family)
VETLISFAEWLQANPQISGFVFVLAFAAILAVGVPGGNVLMLSSGLLFGAALGGLLSWLSLVLAAFVTHALIRTAFGNWLEARAHDARDSVRHFVEEGNFLLLVIPRLIPVIPFFAINVGLTVAGVSKRSYMMSTFLGVIPLAFIFASIGAQLGNTSELSGMYASNILLSPKTYIPLGLLILSTLAGWLWARRHQDPGPD